MTYTRAVPSTLADIEARSDAILRATELPSMLRLAPMDDAAWDALAMPFVDRILSDHPFVEPPALFGEVEAERAAALDGLITSARLHHRYGFWDGERLVGVYRGRQGEGGAYHMTVTALEESWQRRGVYRAFLPKVLEAAREVGFVEVVSRHHADNNPVLVAKLRQGFVITGFDANLRTGLMVCLAYRFADSARKQHRKLVAF
ncbi:MAG: hypothetical protein JRH11_10835 [Deltaproteobacteria bacterium]|nr:hypothetical protein [Deltaproteobacteria bacterium]